MLQRDQKIRYFRLDQLNRQIFSTMKEKKVMRVLLVIFTLGYLSGGLAGGKLWFVLDSRPDNGSEDVTKKEPDKFIQDVGEDVLKCAFSYTKANDEDKRLLKESLQDRFSKLKGIKEARGYVVGKVDNKRYFVERIFNRNYKEESYLSEEILNQIYEIDWGEMSVLYRYWRYITIIFNGK
ncbi:MAG: hypothetical protein OXE99_01900 [Cellvibrionales bacterium]|nr:hypothetical protein [Cellvibrionales bacterium]